MVQIKKCQKDKTMKNDKTQIKEAGDDSKEYFHFRAYLSACDALIRLRKDFADISSALHAKKEEVVELRNRLDKYYEDFDEISHVLHVAERENVQLLEIKKAAQAVVRDADNYEFMFNDDELENLNVLANAVKEQA